MKCILLGMVMGVSSLCAQVDKTTALYKTLLDLDNQFFTAYNTCDMQTQEALLSEYIEFFHDQGGLSTDKQEILDATQKNICNKVRRQLVTDSFEVHEIKDYGAVVMGYHVFFNKEEPNAPQKPSRFIGIWKHSGTLWQMTKIISLH